MRIRKPVLVIELCLLVAFCLATGYILLAQRDAPSTERPVGAGSATTPAPSQVTSGPAAVLTAIPAVAPVPVDEGPVRMAAIPAPTAVAVAGAGGDKRMCSFDATIYDVRLSAQQISQLDVEALTKAAATRDGFEKALAALGTVRPLYRANQSGNLGEEQYIKISDEPASPTTATANATGRGAAPAAPRSAGAHFDLIPREGDAGTIILDIAIKATVLLESAKPPAGAVNAPLFRVLEVQEQRTVTFDKPFLFVNADGSSLDSDGKAMALIVRVTLGRTPAAATTEPAAGK